MKVITFLFLISIVECYAQTAPNISWQQVYGGSSREEAVKIIQTSDGGFVVAGYAASSNGEVGGVTGGSGWWDFWILKLDQSGNIQWKKVIGTNSDDSAEDVQQISDGGYIVCGWAAGGSKWYITRLDSLGESVWRQSFNGGTDGVVRTAAYTVVQTLDGGFVVGGIFGAGSRIMKLDANGTTIWVKNYGRVKSIVELSDGTFVAVGTSDYAMPVMRINSTGDIIWSFLYDTNQIQRGACIKKTSDGNLIIVGIDGRDETGGGYQALLLKLDIDGNQIWSQRYGNIGTDDYFTSVEETSDGGYIAIGSSNSNTGLFSNNHGRSDIWVIKFNSLGIFQWQKLLGGTKDDFGNSIVQTSDGGYVLAGSTESSNGDVFRQKGSIDFWIVKLGGNLCSNITNISGYVSNMHTYQSAQVINLHNAQITNESRINIKSQSSINLLPGVNIHSGTVFKANIEPCSN